jgi:hypothetical protein
VEDLTVVLCVGVETDSTIWAVEREGQVRKFFPPLGLETRTRVKWASLNGSSRLYTEVIHVTGGDTRGMRRER